MTDVTQGASLRLTETEEVVLERLSEQETHAVAPRLSMAYLRLLGLSRTGDPIDGVLAGHLVRELVAALPHIAGVAGVRGHTDYEGHARAIAET